MTRLTLYRKYRPVRGKAPIIHDIRRVLTNEGLIDKLGLVSQLSGVSRSALVGWFGGDTVAPRSETAGAVLSSVGYEITVEKTESIDIEHELQLAAKWLQDRNDKTVKKVNGHAKRR
jgi:hypothetical protein